MVASYPHDDHAFTQGLVVDHGVLYEGTGKYGESTLRRVDLTTGRVEQQHLLDSSYFGEGITIFDGLLYQLTWQSGIGIIYDAESFDVRRTFRYEGEGWGLTHDEKQLIMSDGSATLRFLDPATLEVIGELEVRDGNAPVMFLNELEYIDGEIWSNVWHDDRIARISPKTGRVVSWIDLSTLYNHSVLGSEAVLNGIAYDRTTHRIFVTGKNWPRIFEIEITDH